MAYSKERKDNIFSEICSIIESGKSFVYALATVDLDNSSFYRWCDNDTDKQEQYARACQQRADTIFEEILEISEHSEQDHTPFTGGNVIQRDRLRIDARKWMLSKMNPTKYGDKVQTELSGEVTTNIISLGNGIKPNESNT